MTPVESLGEIERAMEAALAYIDESPCDQDITPQQWQAWKTLKAANAESALATLKELRAGAVEGWAREAEEDARDCSCWRAKAFVFNENCSHQRTTDRPALLIIQGEKK